MAIPKYDELYSSLLNCLADQKIHTNKQLTDFIAEDMRISPESRGEILSSGKNVFYNRVTWACVYLKKAGLIESPKRGHYHITEEGLRVFSSPPPVLDNNFLCRYPSFQSFKNHTASKQSKPKDMAFSDCASVSTEPPGRSNETPQDLIDQAISSLNQNLADDLMSEIMAKDSAFFEGLVVKLLLKMGYGGSVSDSGFVTQKSNDGGIDGIIREDKLGFDQIYIQAKRWDPEMTVSRPEIQRFSGALQDKGASKGLFITTAKFSEGAKDSAEKQHIVLVDGARLTKLMIEYNLGVSSVATYEIKSIDSDFFSDEID